MAATRIRLDPRCVLFEAAVRHDPSHHLARYNLACMWAQSGRESQALEILAAFKEVDCDACRARIARVRVDEDWANLERDATFLTITAPEEP